MIKVLQVSKRYPPYVGGIETVCHDLCSVLKEAGNYDIQVIAFNDQPKTVSEEFEGVPVIRTGLWKSIASQPISFDYKKEIFSLIRNFSPDIIHFHYPDPFAAHFLLKAIKRYHWQGKFILHWHTDIIKQKFLMRFFDRQNKKLLSFADRVIVTSPRFLKDTSYLPYYKKDYAILPCRVGDSRMNVTESQKAFAIRIKEKYPGKTLVFFFGRHVEYKGLNYLIEANQYLDRSKIQILIAGSGPLTQQLKKQAGQFSNIEFLGRLSDEDANSYLLACDIFAFPSITRNEAFGIALAEAMYFGKPACTFEIPGSGVNWVSIKDETGLEAPNADVKAYAENIARLTNDPALYDKLAKQARLRADELFSEEAFRRDALRIYKELEEGLTK